jgi:hypothetical protein
VALPLPAEPEVWDKGGVTDGDVAQRGPAGFHCRMCRSTHVRRSAPHTTFERVVRKITPFHLYRCRDCEYRGWHLGPAALAKHEASESAAPAGRPRERRDVESGRLKRRRIVGSLILAAILGAASGLYLHSCQQGAPASPQ